MTSHPVTDILVTDAHVDEILAELNASGSGSQGLDDLVARSDVKPDRIIEGPDITYVRLVGRAEGGGPVVILRFEGIWERAMKSAPIPPKRDGTQESTAAEARRPFAHAHARMDLSRSRRVRNRRHVDGSALERSALTGL